MYEVLIKGGTVKSIRPQEIHGKRDIGISSAKIAALTGNLLPSQANRVIDATGKLVTPGPIDMHAHVAGDVILIGL